MAERKVFRNDILASLPRQEMQLLAQHMEEAILPRQFMIASPGRTIDHVYFLEKGLGLIICVAPDGRRTQVGMFGPEAFAPAPPAARFGLSLHEVVMYTPGSGYRIAVRHLWQELSCCPELAGLLAKSVLNFASQASFAALSNAIDTVEQRLARWLLMACDRLGVNEVELTHSHLAKVLGARRPTITTSLHALEERGFVKSRRGFLVVRNRSAMAKFVTETYGRVEQEHRDLILGAKSSDTAASPAAAWPT